MKMATLLLVSFVNVLFVSADQGQLTVLLLYRRTFMSAEVAGGYASHVGVTMGSGGLLF